MNMKRMWAVLGALSLAFAASAPAVDSPTIGVVVLHGKWDSPGGHMSGLAAALKEAGFFVERPELPWSGRRAYDQDMDHFVTQMDGVVKTLRDRGANRIVLVGHSMGGNGAVYYAGRSKVDGVVVIAPGQFPEGRIMRAQFEEDLKRAERLVRNGGTAEDRVVFTDTNSGNRARAVRVPARSFISYFSPDGPMNFTQNCAHVKSATPVLWITPDAEPDGIKRLGEGCYARLPADPLSSHVQVPGEHLDAPDASKTIVREWLQTLIHPAQKGLAARERDAGDKWTRPCVWRDERAIHVVIHKAAGS
jgi:pimeloyl-ACP methyl ester carboxylesterase